MALLPQGKSHALPKEYITVKPVELNTSKAAVPVCETKQSERCLAVEKQKERRWMEHSLGKLDQETFSNSDTFTWAAFHASTQSEIDPPALTALLPQC